MVGVVNLPAFVWSTGAPVTPPGTEEAKGGLAAEHRRSRRRERGRARLEMAVEVAPPTLVGFPGVTPVSVVRAPVSLRLVPPRSVVCAGIRFCLVRGAPVAGALKPLTLVACASFHVR